MTRPVDPEGLAARFISLEVHESTHDRLVWGMRQNRDKAVAGVPEWAELRDLASRIKEHTLTHLDRYLCAGRIPGLARTIRRRCH